MIDLDEAERVGKAAQEAPWFSHTYPDSLTVVRQREPGGSSVRLCLMNSFDEYRETAEFIVYARNHWDEILDELRRRRENEIYVAFGKSLLEVIEAIDDAGVSGDTPRDEHVNSYIAAWSKQKAEIERLAEENKRLVSMMNAVMGVK